MWRIALFWKAEPAGHRECALDRSDKLILSRRLFRRFAELAEARRDRQLSRSLERTERWERLTRHRRDDWLDYSRQVIGQWGAGPLVLRRLEMLPELAARPIRLVIMLLKDPVGQRFQPPDLDSGAVLPASSYLAGSTRGSARVRGWRCAFPRPGSSSAALAPRS